MRPSFYLLSAAAVLVAACSDQTTGPTPESFQNHIVITSGDPAAVASINGHVFGVDTATTGADTAVGGNTHPDLPGIPIEVYQMVPGTGLPDSAGQTPMVEELKGTGESGADGKFTISGIPAGQYVVYAKPPAGNLWHSTSGWTLASDGSSQQVLEMGLYRRSVVSGQ